MKRFRLNYLHFFYFMTLSGFLVVGCNQNKKAKTLTGWDKVPAILEKINPPTFPDKDFSILDYGAKSDSTTDCLPAIKEAIAACNKAGGGRVVIPEGTYLVNGPIHLKNNVNLHLEKGAVVKFSTDPEDYLPVVLTRYEGLELMNYSPLIYAYGKENIAVTGEGVFDGQASKKHWWWWSGSKDDGWKEGMPSQGDANSRPLLTKMAVEGVPVEKRIFGEGHYLRPTFLEFYKCKNILIKDITIKNTPFWILHPTLSQNITIDGVSTISYGPNNDGCDPESCTNIQIKNCFFSNGDDCIAIKSGRDEDGRRIDVPTKNIVIENCVMKDGHGGVVVGSETSGGVENLFVRNCEMSSPNLDRAIRIKSNACRGGVSKNFYFKDIKVGQVHEAVIKVNMFYGDDKTEGCNYPPTLDSVFIKNVTSQKSEYAIYIKGRKDKPVSNIFISDCDFNNVEKENIIQQAENVKLNNITVNGELISRNQ